MAKLNYTEEHEAFRHSVRRYFEDECVPNRQEWEREGIVSRSAWNRAADLGFLCYTIDERYGGLGADILYSVVLLEEQIRSGAPAINLSLHNDIVAPYLDQFGTPEQKANYLPKMASGELLGAIAVSETGAGHDLLAIKTSAKRGVKGYVINGRKTFVTNGHIADLILLVAQTHSDVTEQNLSIFLVETESLSGFDRGRNLQKLGQKSSDTAELLFNDVVISDASVLGGIEGQGFSQLVERLAYERLMTGIVAVAVMEHAIDITLNYVKERQAFGRKIIDFQNSRFKLAECATSAMIARTFLNRCLALSLEDRLDAETAAMLKWWTTEQQCQIVDICLQLHGGYGYMNDYQIARLWADSRASKILSGTNEAMKEIIGRSL